MNLNEKKKMLKTVVTYLEGALAEAKDELAVLEKEPEQLEITPAHIQAAIKKCNLQPMSKQLVKDIDDDDNDYDFDEDDDI